ncbi:hypothetical protein GCM10010425_79820 [Streptomyces spororaveus]|uniref:Uncharacterized protein n=1 Tax=Streptomyces spororaveus TaxID=284039 RepID=A0ABQ3TC39_9ACTN|nr:hypothetical protein Sspor_35140 [Streptomyces spororaveus]
MPWGAPGCPPGTSEGFDRRYQEPLIPARQLRAGGGQYGGRAAELPAHGTTGGGANRENLP